MGERLNGIQEVGSSILPGSTNLPNDTKTISRPSGRFWFMKKVVKTYKVGAGGVWSKTLVQQANAGKTPVIRQAPWGLSEGGDLASWQ
jgi:hypothetical protein